MTLKMIGTPHGERFFAVTDSPRLEEVFAAVLAEAIDAHTERAHGYVLGTPERDAMAQELAEQLAARFEQVGWLDNECFMPVAVSFDTSQSVPVFRLVGGDQ